MYVIRAQRFLELEVRLLRVLLVETHLRYLHSEVHFLFTNQVSLRIRNYL